MSACRLFRWLKIFNLFSLEPTPRTFQEVIISEVIIQLRDVVMASVCSVRVVSLCVLYAPVCVCLCVHVVCACVCVLAVCPTVCELNSMKIAQLIDV